MSNLKNGVKALVPAEKVTQFPSVPKKPNRKKSHKNDQKVRRPKKVKYLTPVSKTIGKS